MKRIPVMLVMVIAVITSLSAQKAKVNYEPKGKWQFEAPYAPEGFTSGTIEVGKVEDKMTAMMSFTGNEAKLPLENVKFANDTLKASVTLEGETIAITLKFEEADKMSGKAAYSQGEVPLTLAREKKK